MWVVPDAGEMDVSRPVAGASPWTPGVGRPAVPLRGTLDVITGPRTHKRVWRCEHRHPDEASATACAQAALADGTWMEEK